MIPLADTTWDRLCAINESVNAEIEYRAGEPWQIILPGQAAVGDCRTFAATKAQRLADAGFDPDRIWIAECAVPPSKAVNHALVRIQTDHGDYFLSNGYDDPLDTDELAVMGWTMLEQFKHGTRATVMETLG